MDAPLHAAASSLEADTRPALRFLTCGSVDDGKSTLIGRLLYEQNLIFDDHLAALTRDSKKHGTTGAEVDFALLLDGLEAEREQGITIDVAYRYFATPRRSFIVADTPGHEQYTRNMATGASNAELAVLLVDARKGLLSQTRRHAIIASLLGIRYAVLAVNKIDLVGYDASVFEHISTEFRTFAAQLGFKEIVCIPISARYGDNVSARSAHMPWYTRNMATGASNAELAVLLVDARKGLLSQTRRHAIIASLLGIRYAVLAVNKIDLVGYDASVFEHISTEFRTFAAQLGFKEIVCIPISARYGDNVSARSAHMPWYSGPLLLDHLESVDVEDDRAARPFRMPVQWVNRPNSDFRGFTGTVVGGGVRAGDEVVVLPSGQSSRVKSIVGGDAESAEAGDAVTLTLTDEIDVVRGDMFAAPRDRPQVADQFAAHLVWMSAERLMPGRSYLIKMNHNTIAATVTDIKHRIDVNSLSKLAAKTLSLNEVGVCNLSLARALPFDPYTENRDSGAFILIDRYSNETVAAGMIDFALRRATNIHHQSITVTKTERKTLMHHGAAVLWFTGLSGAGKSTIANLVESGLHARGVHTVLLDGDNVRHGLNKDLGFTESDRVENIRRIGEVARLMTEAGLVVLCSFISPFRAERRMVRELLDADEFIEIFVDTPVEECVARDPKGLYKRALAGEIKNFTGVDQAYEVPENPELRLMAGEQDAATLAHRVIDDLISRKIV